MTTLFFWLRWSWRDLRERWLLVAAIAATIGIGTGAYAGLTSTSAWRQAANEASYSALRMFDVRVRLQGGATVPTDRLETLARSIQSSDQISQTEERLVLPTQVDASKTAGRTTIVPGEAIGVDVESPEAPIAGMFARQGRELNAADAGRDVAALDYHFAANKGLPPTGSLELPGGVELEYVGQILTPEYFLVTNAAGGLLAESNFAAFVVPIDTLQEATGLDGRVNDVLIRLRPGTDRDEVKAELESLLESSLPGTLVDVDTASDDEAYRVLYDNIDTDQRFYSIFALVILTGATLAAFNLTSRIVESQRRQIGIGMALGLRPRWLAFRPVLVGAQVALLGVVLGIVAGLIIGQGMDGILQKYFPMPIWSSPFQPDVFLQAAVLGFALPFVASLYPVWRAVTVPPIEAIRTGFMSARGSGFAPLVAWLRVPGGALAQMPFRNVLRTPRRTLLTAIGVAAAVTTLVGTTGTTDTMLRTIDVGQHEVVQGNERRLAIGMVGLQPADSTRSRLRATGVVDRVDPQLVLGGTAHHHGRELDLTFRLVDLEGGQWRPTVTDGRMPRVTSRDEPPEILLSEGGAQELGVEPGDLIRVTATYLNGGKLEDRDIDVRVAGLQPIPLRFSAFMDYAEAHRFGMRGLANEFSATPASGETVETVQQELFDMPDVAIVEPVATTSRIFRHLVDQYLSLLVIVQVTALALALLIAFNTAQIALDERSREHATMFAFGTRLRTVLSMSVVESALIGAAGTVMGIVGGRIVVEFIVRAVLVDVVPDVGFVVWISLATLVTAAALGIATVALAPLIGTRRLMNTNVPDALRVVE